MNQIEKKYIELINNRYTQSLNQHGNSPKRLGWASVEQQHTRFERFKKYLPTKVHSITDIGCGFGDFASFLSSSNYQVQSKYIGVDINPNLLDIAITCQYSFNTQFFCGDLLEKEFHKTLAPLNHEVIIAAGLFNLNFYGNNIIMCEFLFSMLNAMVNLNPSRIIFDFIPAERSDSYPKEDYISVYDISSLISYLNEHQYSYIIDLMQPPNPMTEALLVIDLK